MAKYIAAEVSSSCTNIDCLPCLWKSSVDSETSNIRKPSGIKVDRLNSVGQTLHIDAIATVCRPRWKICSIRITCFGEIGPVLTQRKAKGSICCCWGSLDAEDCSVGHEVAEDVW